MDLLDLLLDHDRWATRQHVVLSQACSMSGIASASCQMLRIAA
jgi:hypothetical protein